MQEIKKSHFGFIILPHRSLLSGFALLAAMGVMEEASAQMGYDQSVIGWCTQAERRLPSAIPCQICHKSSAGGGQPSNKTRAQYTAFQSLRSNSTDAAALNAFCKQNRAPELKLSPAKSVNTVKEGKTLTIKAKAKDPDKDRVTYAATSLPQGADFNASSGVFQWTPPANSAGTYTFTVGATDAPPAAAKPLTASQQVTVNVVASGKKTSRAPQLDSIPPQSSAVGQEFRYTISAYDPDNRSLTLVAENLPAGASFTEKGQVNGKWNGELVWTPSPEQFGRTVQIVFTAKDDSPNPTQVVDVLKVDVK
ncbi:MAG: Ig domain-containing protein [Methylococcaceae bacterium]|nr:Ig domain-containing protein [Methylococcaceae bacterium]